jgi:hypothetical protein
MQKGSIRKIILAIFVIMFIMLVNPWTFDSFINHVEPWVGPFPWSIFITYGLLLLSCLLLAVYQKLEDI